MNANLKQRADYTYKYNVQSGRHGWLRLTPAYSVKIVEEVLSMQNRQCRVLDPFCGSGTTALCAARLGLESTTTDINPFLVWLAAVKTRSYSNHDIAGTQEALEVVLCDAAHHQNPAPAPPIHNIDRWWSNESQMFLCAIKGAIDNANTSLVTRDLLNLAFCRTLIKVSNAAFNHQSMSFKNREGELGLAVDHADIFRADVESILQGCADELNAKTEVTLQDARSLQASQLGKFDLVLTSPPYANRMSYIRELRPYMYWLGFLHETKDAGELDWRAIGGTWGIATSRLNNWSASENYKNKHLAKVVSQISSSDNRHADILARYVHKYHEDIYAHFLSLTDLLQKGARVHYIVGNSTFYGVLVSVERIYADMMQEVGFSDIQVRSIRKRNSEKALVEFEVSASWCPASAKKV